MILYYLLVSAMPLTRHPLWAEFVGELTIIKYVGLGCVLYMVVHCLQRRMAPRFLETWQARWFWMLTGLATVAYFIMGSSDPLQISPLMAYISFAVFFFITLVVVDSVHRLRNVLVVAIGSMAFASVYVLREWQKGGFAAGSRPGWVTGDPNYFTVSALLFLPMALYLSQVARNRAERVFCMACFGITLLAVFAASSRGGFLGLLAAFAYFGLRSRRRAAVITLACVALVTMAVVLPSSPLTRLMDPHESDVEASDSRLRLWTVGMKAALEHPLTGVGPGNYKTLTVGREDFQVAHNTYVELAAELGFPGLFGFLAVLTTTYLSAGRIRRRAALSGSKVFVNISQGIQAGLLGYAVSAVFVSVPWQKFLWLVVFLSITLEALWRTAPAPGSAAVSAGRRTRPPLVGDGIIVRGEPAIARPGTRSSLRWKE
jgi:putative inorganic carbon (hco3(-)) transporter